MRTVHAFLLAILLPAVASAQQPNTFPVWERPAAGVFLGASGNGDLNSRASAADVGFVFDTPVVFGYRARADVSRVAWRFGARDPRGVLHFSDTVALTSIRLGLLRVWQLSPRMTGYAGGGYGAYHYDYRATPLHNAWRGGLHVLAGWEVVGASQRYALDGEIRLHGIDGTGQPPVFSDTLYKLDAALGMKVRF